MSFKFEQEQRKVIPRWRSLFRTRPIELKSCTNKHTSIVGTDEELTQKSSLWQSDSSLGNAADFLFSGFNLGKSSLVLGAAKQIVRDATSTSMLAKLAGSAVRGDEPIIKELKSTSEQYDNARQAISHLRARSIEFPRNAFLKIELARQYSTLGQIDQAIRAIEIACFLAPENRYVLRSAARLFLHAGEADRAHWLLRRAECVRHDPWVLASEVAVGSLAGKTTKFAKEARQMLSADNFYPEQITELASSIATLELDHGANKKAKRLFRQSLKWPNDNSLAQAIWASKTARAVNLQIPEKWFRIPNSYEAAALAARNRAEWIKMVSHCESWMKDESFSVRPVALGSYGSAVLLGDFQKTVEFADAGLRSNKNDPVLQNNKIVGLVNLGRVEEARTIADNLTLPKPSDELYVSYFATSGLLAFRSGDLREGQFLYRKSIELAESQDRPDDAILALLHLAKEEALAHCPGAEKTLGEAKEAVQSTKNPELHRALEVIEKAIVQFVPTKMQKSAISG